MLAAILRCGGQHAPLAPCGAGTLTSVHNQYNYHDISRLHPLFFFLRTRTNVSRQHRFLNLDSDNVDTPDDAGMPHLVFWPGLLHEARFLDVMPTVYFRCRCRMSWVFAFCPSPRTRQLKTSHLNPSRRRFRIAICLSSVIDFGPCGNPSRL